MKRNSFILACVVLALSLFPSLHLFAQGAKSAAAGIALNPGRTPSGAEAVAPGGVATLYALDPLTQSLCFADGMAGHVFQENEVKNRCSDVDFDSYNEGSFTVGVEGARRGVILDLGDAAELKERYGYAETVGNGQGFASLHVEDGKAVILKAGSPRAFQELKESAQLFGPVRASASAPVKVGHIYLIRLTDDYDRGFQRLGKMKVISYTPGVSVTIRWQAL